MMVLSKKNYQKIIYEKYICNKNTLKLSYSSQVSKMKRHTGGKEVFEF